MIKLVHLVQAAWNISDKEEAEKALTAFIHLFGTEGAEKHLSLNAAICAIGNISPYDYLEMCIEVERILNTSKMTHSYFIAGIGDLIMARNAT